MSTEWIALAIAVVLGAGAILATRQWGNRRRKLVFTFELAPLLPPGIDKGPLQVTYREHPVDDPHLVLVSVRNVGPSDIASGHFDGGEPFRVNLNALMYGLTGNSHPDRSIISTMGHDGVVALSPQLLRRGEEWAFEAVVQGECVPTVESPLIDTDVLIGPSFREQITEALAGVTISLPLGVTVRLSR